MASEPSEVPTSTVTAGPKAPVQLPVAVTVVRLPGQTAHAEVGAGSWRLVPQMSRAQ